MSQRGYVILHLRQEPNVWVQFTAIVAKNGREAIAIATSAGPIQHGTFRAIPSSVWARCQVTK